jgi:hypothetical protein
VSTDAGGNEATPLEGRAVDDVHAALQHVGDVKARAVGASRMSCGIDSEDDPSGIGIIMCDGPGGAVSCMKPTMRRVLMSIFAMETEYSQVRSMYAPSGRVVGVIHAATARNRHALLQRHGVRVSKVEPRMKLRHYDRYTVRCETANGASWLQVTPLDTPGDTRPAVTQTLGPTWGLHLYDVNLALGDLVDLVKTKAQAFHAPNG